MEYHDPMTVRNTWLALRTDAVLQETLGARAFASFYFMSACWQLPMQGDSPLLYSLLMSNGVMQLTCTYKGDWDSTANFKSVSNPASLSCAITFYLCSTILLCLTRYEMDRYRFFHHFSLSVRSTSLWLGCQNQHPLQTRTSNVGVLLTMMESDLIWESIRASETLPILRLLQSFASMCTAWCWWARHYHFSWRAPHHFPVYRTQCTRNQAARLRKDLLGWILTACGGWRAVQRFQRNSATILRGY